MNSVDYNDQQIITLCQSADTIDKGFGLLMMKYQERLYWHIRRMVKNHEDTDDILQNTFVKVYRNLDKYRSDAKLYTWLYRIATNETLDHFRKDKGNLSVSIDDETDHVVSLVADDYFDGNHLQRELAIAINALPEKQKLVFNLRYYDEMPYADMAEVLETSVGALKASYHLAVKKIEKYIRK